MEIRVITSQARFAFYAEVFSCASQMRSQSRQTEEKRSEVGGWISIGLDVAGMWRDIN